MDTNSRAIVGLSLVLVFLSWWLMRSDGSSQEEQTPLWTLPVVDVTRVEVVRPDDTVVLLREAETWSLSQPLMDTRVDERRVEQLLLSLAGLQVDEIVASPDEDGEPYGLGDPPHLQVSLTMSSGRTHGLAVGLLTPVGYGTYARRSDGSVVALRGDLHRELLIDAAAFRDHRLLSFDPARVRAVELWGPNGTLRARGEGTQWWLDGFGRADPDRVDDLVMGLLDVRFDAILDLEEEIAQPLRTATVELDDGTRLVARVGEDTPLGTLVWAPDDRRGTVVSDALMLLEQGPSDLGVREAFGIDLDRSDRVEVTLGDQSVTLMRESGVWAAEGYERADALDLVQALADVGVRYERAAPPAVEDRWGGVTVWEGETSRSVALGPLHVDVHSAQDEAGGPPFRIPSRDLQAARELLR
ncbi:MAG: DUF4340 domain-containing protein [Myxococcales bacterium]|nr:DUF4340 domain-containing protein [Myxococcales bacterium]